MWADASPQADVTTLGNVYAQIDYNFSGGFVKVDGDAKVVSLHHMGFGYSYGGQGFRGRTTFNSTYDLPTINTTFS